MAIKDLFDEQKSQSTKGRGASKKTLEELSKDAESTAYIKQYAIQEREVVADLDYSDPASFVKYGSAKKYYENAIKRIYSQYPYDGSAAEKLEFKNNLTQFERHILENEYPKTTGYAEFGRNWGGKSVFGGTYAGAFGATEIPEYIQFNSQVPGNIYDADVNRRGNLHLNFVSGSTVEWWMKINQYPNATTETNDMCILQISGGHGHATHTGQGHEFTIYVARSEAPNVLGVLYNTYTGGAHTGVILAELAFSPLPSLDDKKWHHYAITTQQTSTTNVNFKTYLDGIFVSSSDVGVTALPTAISGALVGTVGALGNSFYGVHGLLGYGKLSGSIDELRVWRKARNAQEIGRNYFRGVYGGTNTDDVKYTKESNVDLGVYYKFNEGIVKTGSIDQTVLDYSGRGSNGLWTYESSSYSRHTGSAINEAAVSTEEPDPIIYRQHPSVLNLQSNLFETGSQYDATNNGSLINSMPMWVLDEDNATGEVLTNFLQVMSSYLDTLYMQITQMRKFKDADYQENNNVGPNPYNARLLNSMGFEAPELFVDADVVKSIFDQDDKRKYEEKISTIKNLIYKNIYNNLSYINKSKGTLKAFRNLMRCYGIDDQLFNYNIYADNAQYLIEDDYINTAIKKDFIDQTPFSSSQNSEGVIYSFAEPNNRGSTAFLSGSTNNSVGFTLLTDVIFPKTPPKYFDVVGLTQPSNITASIFGTVTARADEPLSLAPADPDDAGLNVYAIRTDNTVQFELYSDRLFNGEEGAIRTREFYDVYDNSKWTFSVSVKPKQYPFSDMAISASSYTLEFNGYNYDLDVLVNKFNKTLTLGKQWGQAFLTGSKRVYAGASRQNVTGALQLRANQKLLSVMAWGDHLTGSEIESHARDIEAYGRANPGQNAFVFEDGLDGIYIPKVDTLMMHWGFNTVTASNPSGDFIVPDMSSGSKERILPDLPMNYSEMVDIQNTGKGSEFVPLQKIKKIDFINLAKQQLPENLNVSNMIEILDSDDDLLFMDSRPIKTFIAFEASMYDVISREMLKMFASVNDLNNMIGDPLNYYHLDYKHFRSLRDRFFNKIKNSPDLDKYVNLYKFLDSAIEGVIHNLIPASAEASEKVRTIVENHILERNKYTKPIFQTKNGLAAKRTSVFDGQNVQGEPKGIPICSIENNPYTKTSKTVLAFELPDTYDNVEPNPQGAAYQLTIENPGISSPSHDAIVTQREDFQPLSINNSPAADNFVDNYLNQYEQNRFNKTSDNNTGVSTWYKFKAKRDDPAAAREDISDGFVGDPGARATLLYVHSVAKTDRILDCSRVVKLRSGIQNTIKNQNVSFDIDPNTLLPIFSNESISNIINVVTGTRGGDVYGNRSQVFFPFDGTPFKNKLQLDISLDVDWADKELHINAKQMPIYFVSASTSHGKLLIGDQEFIVNGQHKDALYHNGETPMQGPFTNQHVGGFKHRHIAPGLDPEKFGTGEEEEGILEQDRPEIFKIANNTTTPAGTSIPGEVKIFNPRIRDPFSIADDPTYNLDIPRVKFSREELVKRAVNIRNISHITSSKILGNFDKNYQVLSTADRSVNNPAFVQQGGFGAPSASFSPFLSGTYEYLVPRRSLSDNTHNKTVIVPRFSAPGDVTTMTPAYLDFVSGQFSAYNALSYRNLNVRNSLNDFMQTPTAHNSAFYQSGSDATPATASYHKIPSNGLPRLKFIDGVLLKTGSNYDNGFVQRQIPRSDFGYSWIKESAIKPNQGQDGVTPLTAPGGTWAGTGSKPAFLVSMDAYYGFATSSNGVTFISASDVVSYLTASTNVRTFGLDKLQANYGSPATHYIPVDFVGMNTVIHDPLSSSLNMLGYNGLPVAWGLDSDLIAFPVGPPGAEGREWDTEAGLYLNPTVVRRIVSGSWREGLGSPGFASILNAVTLNRNGPYGYPSWKMIRGGEHKVARYLNENNFARADAGRLIRKQGDIFVTEGEGGDITINRPNTIKVTLQDAIRVQHAKVTSKYKPIVHELNSDELLGDQSYERYSKIKYTHANNYGFYGDYYNATAALITNLYPEKNISTVKKNDSVLYNLSGIYTGRFLQEDVSSPRMIRLSYSEIVWPKETHTYMNTSRKRTLFTFKQIWRSNIQNRISSSFGIIQTNTNQHQPIFSSWPMDYENVTQSNEMPKRVNIPPQAPNINGLNYGELMNLSGSAMYESPSHNTADWNVRYGRYRLALSGADTPFRNLRSTPKNLVHEQAKDGAFFDSYEEWAADIRTIGKDYSIIPEYKLDDYADSMISDEKYFASINQNLTLTGSEAQGQTISDAGSRQPESQPIKFLERYCHSDMVSSYDFIRDLHNEEATSISITVHGIKKMLPYKGFYPQNRTLQLGYYFWNEFQAENFEIDGFHSAHGSLQTAINVLFNRLVYGSIRAGVAIDTATYNGGAADSAEPLMTGPGSTNLTAQRRMNPTGSWIRIPWDAILDPIANAGRPQAFGGTNAVLNEADPQDPFSSTCSLLSEKHGRFSKASTNFFANVTDIFIESSNLTIIKSAPQQSWNFDFNKYSQYSMDIAMKKLRNFTNHDDFAANGAPYTAHSCFYQSGKDMESASDPDNLWYNHIVFASSSINFKPKVSWFENEARVTILFDARQFSASIGDKEKSQPTLADILQYSTKEYYNHTMYDTFRNCATFERWVTTQTDTGKSNNPATSSFMTMAAGVDLYNLDKNDDTWTINTKWECPVHNYTNVDTQTLDGSAGDQQAAAPGDQAGDVTRGVWHQFSEDTDSKLMMELRGPDDTSIGNLAQAVGFTTEKYKIGQVAEKMPIQEYVVVVPYTINEEGEDQFFFLPIDDFEESYRGYTQEGIISNSIQEMINKMEKCVLPPVFDFVQRRKNPRFSTQADYSPVLPPFAMYILEFTMLLDKTDLSRWWQGVMPTQCKTAEKESVTVKHPIAPGELISPKLLNNPLYRGKLPEEIRFKVFKAKKRGLRSYNDLLDKSYGIEPSTVGWTYNWPYDFFSMVEMAKVETTFEFGAPRDSTGRKIETVTRGATDGGITALGTLVNPFGASAPPAIAANNQRQQAGARDAGRDGAAPQGRGAPVDDLPSIIAGIERSSQAAGTGRGLPPGPVEPPLPPRGADRAPTGRQPTPRAVEPVDAGPGARTTRGQTPPAGAPPRGQPRTEPVDAGPGARTTTGNNRGGGGGRGGY